MYLFADDNDSVLEALALMFPGLPKVRTLNLEDAVALTREHQPKIAIIDVRYPWGRSGVDALADLLAAAPECNVFFITAEVDAGDRRRAMEGGAAGYFTKDELHLLQEAIEALLDDEPDVLH